MRDLYTHIRNIYLITRTLEQRMALLRPARGFPSRAWLPKAAPRPRSWTASNSSTAKSMPPPTGFSATPRGV